MVRGTQWFSTVMKVAGSHSTSYFLLVVFANLIKEIMSLYKLFLSYLKSRVEKPTYINMCLLCSCILQHKKTYQANGHAMICFVSKKNFFFCALNMVKGMNTKLIANFARI